MMTHACTFCHDFGRKRGHTFTRKGVIDKRHIRSMSQRDWSLRGVETDGFSDAHVGFMVQAAVITMQRWWQTQNVETVAKSICTFNTQRKRDENLALQWTSICAEKCYCPVRDECLFTVRCHSSIKSKESRGFTWLMKQRHLIAEFLSFSVRLPYPRPSEGSLYTDPGPCLCSWCQLNTISRLSGETINNRGNQRCLRSWGYCAPDQDRGIQTVEDKHGSTETLYSV